MRILLATDSYPPPLIGGRDLHVRMLGQELARRGHEVRVVALAGSHGQHTEPDGDVTVHRLAGWSRVLNRFYLDPQRPWHPTAPDPGLVGAIRGLVREFRPDVIHAHSWIVHSILPLLPSAGVPLVLTMHDYGLVCPRNSFMRGDRICDGPGFAKCIRCAKDQYGGPRAAALTTGLRLSRPLHHRITRLIAVSNFVATVHHELVDALGSGIDIIPPFLSDDTFAVTGAVTGAATGAVTGQPPERPAFLPAGEYVMFAGALSPHKGLPTLLAAYAQGGLDLPLVVVGLNNSGRPIELPRGVVAVENVAHDQVLRAWVHCAVAVVPSEWPDPSPLTAMEAMAAGRPVVASAVGGLRDLVVDNTTGLLVRPGDPAALGAAIADLVADPGRRAEMGAAGRARAAGWAAAALLPRIEAVYGDAIERVRPAGRGASFAGRPGA